MMACFLRDPGRQIQLLSSAVAALSSHAIICACQLSASPAMAADPSGTTSVILLNALSTTMPSPPSPGPSPALAFRCFFLAPCPPCSPPPPLLQPVVVAETEKKTSGMQPQNRNAEPGGPRAGLLIMPAAQRRAFPARVPRLAPGEQVQTWDADLRFGDACLWVD